jgi:hypothetical protein|tara:strand:- start:22 stop:327 length:306 start_codon:yes stop_codon:yes gene_type:complete
MSKNIKIVRLITGEDLIGEVAVSEDIVEIKKPFIIYPTQQPRPGEAIKFGMFTFIPYAETDSVKIEQSKTLLIVEPKQDLLASYNQSVSKIIQKTGPQLIT